MSDVVKDPAAPNLSVQVLQPVHSLFVCSACRWSMVAPADRPPTCDRCGAPMEPAKRL